MGIIAPAADSASTGKGLRLDYQDQGFADELLSYPK